MYGDLDGLECLNRLECQEIWTVRVSEQYLEFPNLIKLLVVGGGGGAFGKKHQLWSLSLLNSEI